MLNAEQILVFNENLPKANSQQLCEIIATSRYLGSMKEIAVTCMTELARRRECGENFQYEKIIEDEFKKFPFFKIDLKKKMNLGFDLSVLKGIK